MMVVASSPALIGEVKPRWELFQYMKRSVIERERRESDEWRRRSYCFVVARVEGWMK